MRKKALIVSSANPYPVVTSGCERLIVDYQHHLLSDYDVYYLSTDPVSWQPRALYHQDDRLADAVTIDELLGYAFEFALFVGFKSNDFMQRLARQLPAFCLTDTHPQESLPADLFKGIMAHRTSSPNDALLLLGASYNSDVFFKQREPESLVLCVARIHPDKNQLELVRDYKRRIYERYGLPLYLVGGVGDEDYFCQVSQYIDQISVLSTINREQPLAISGWKSPAEVAAFCNRARLFVMASPKESFCMALIEAMACATTCVINGNYWGFDEDDIRPNVFGNTTAKRGDILDLVDEALRRDVRIDGSAWAKKFSLNETKVKLLSFINERLGDDNRRHQPAMDA
jgi:glycosyltransferase involved in cell wall biosynthesis